MADEARHSPDPAAPDRPRRTRWLWLGLGIVGLLVVGAFLAFHYITRTAYVEDRLASALASATDSLYQVQLGDVDASLLRRSIRAEEIVLRPDSSVLARQPADAQPSRLVTVTVPSVRIAGIDLWALLRDRDVVLQSIQVEHPHVQFAAAHQTDDEATSSDTSTSTATVRRAASSLHAQLARQLPYVEIGQVAIDSALVTGAMQAGSAGPPDTVQGLSVRLDQVRIDSTSARDTSRVLFSETVQFQIAGYRHVSSDSLYRLETGPIQASTHDSSLTVDSLRWAPTVSDEAFFQQQPYRTDRYDMGFGTLSLHNIDYWNLIDRRSLAIANTVLDAPWASIYYDRTLPEKPTTPPATLPHDAFQTIPWPVRIDTIRIHQGDIRYDERAEDGTEPGTIRFADVWATVYNVTNDTSRMTASSPAVIDAETKVADAGLLQTTIDYNLLAPRLTMAYSGTLGSMDARAFNNIFVDLEGIRITSGHIDSLWFDLEVEQNVATGGLQVFYRDLQVEMLDKVTQRRDLGERLQTLIANNFVLNEENTPGDDSPAQIAAIHHERPPEMPLFQFLWQTLRNGLYTTIGL